MLAVRKTDSAMLVEYADSLPEIRILVILGGPIMKGNQSMLIAEAPERDCLLSNVRVGTGTRFGEVVVSC